MDFVLTLHGHLPYVLHHGRWPHLRAQDAVFPNVLQTVTEVLG
jgi:hypothetical protein